MSQGWDTAQACPGRPVFSTAPAKSSKRRRTSSSEVLDPTVIDSKGKGRQQTKVQKTKGKASETPLFRCPFFEKNPEHWEHGICEDFSNNIDSLCRHHMEFHRKQNLKLPNGHEHKLNPRRFARIADWKDGIKHKKVLAEHQYQQLKKLLFEDEQCPQAVEFRKHLSKRAATDDTVLDTVKEGVNGIKSLHEKLEKAESAINAYFVEKVDELSCWKARHLQRLKEVFKIEQDTHQFIRHTGSDLTPAEAGFSPVNNDGDKDILVDLPEIQAEDHFAGLPVQGAFDSFFDTNLEFTQELDWSQHYAQPLPQFADPQAGYFFPTSPLHLEVEDYKNSDTL